VLIVDELRIEVNKACNFACVHCYTNKVSSSDLPVGSFTRLISSAAENKVANLSLTGGEPLLALSRTLALIEHGARLGMAVRLNTNGFLLNESTAEKLKKAGLSEVQISLNSSNENDFDEFVQRSGAYRRVVEAIQASKHWGLFVSIRFTLMLRTINQLLPTFKFAVSLGVDKFKVRTLVQVNNISETHDLHARDRLREALEEVVRSAKGNPITLAIADDGLGAALDNGENSRRLVCKCGAEALFVASDGNITPCPFLREDPEYHLGNIEGDNIFDLSTSSAVLVKFIGTKERPKGGGNDCMNCCKAAQVSEVRSISLEKSA
jgi:radical SAM protein with 4Fe4S-binding SPASM domain